MVTGAEVVTVAPVRSLEIILTFVISSQHTANTLIIAGTTALPSPAVLQLNKYQLNGRRPDFHGAIFVIYGFFMYKLFVS